MKDNRCPNCGTTLRRKDRKTGLCPSCRTRKTRTPSPLPEPSAPVSVSPAISWGGKDWLIAALLVTIPFLVLSPLLRCDFINLDDPEYITANPQVQAGLSKDGFLWAWTTFLSSNWHPLTWLSLMVDSQLFGTRPWGYHLTNLLLHLASTVVLFVWLRGATGVRGASALVAALFAVHPLHVESVAWVTERKDVLSTLFGMLALVAYTRYARSGSLSRYLLVVAFLALSLLAKPMLVTLPFLFLLLDYWPLRRWPAQASARRLLLEKVRLLVLVLFSCVMTLIAQHRGGAVNSLKLTPLSERLANSSLAYVQYLGQTIAPLNLAVFYPFPHGRVSFPLALAAGLLLACLTWLAWRERKSRPYFLVGWLWYLGTMVPVIGVVQVGGQAHADRYTYFPLIGIFLLVVWGLADLSRHLHKERLGAWLAGAGLALLMLLSWHQASLWSDSVTLWTHAIEATENNWMAYKLLDDAYAKQGRRDKAERFFRERVRSNPADAGAQNALGQVLSDRGNIEEAHRHFQEALRLGPENSLVHYNLGQILLREKRPAEAAKYLRAYLKEDPNSGQGHNLLGLALMDMGQPEEAANHFEQALQLAPEFAGLSGQTPDSAPVLYNLGGALQTQGKWLEAADCFERTVALRPQSSKYHRALAYALEHLGRPQESQKEYRESLRLDANWPLAAAQTAWVLATHPDARQRNGGQALDYALQAYQAAGAGDPRILDALAAAYAETGQFEEAARTAKQAAEQADKISQRELAQDIRNRLNLYTDKKSYHASP